MRRSAVVVVDPYSTGRCIAAEVQERGHAVIALWSNDHLAGSDVIKSAGYAMELHELEDISQTANAVHEALAGSVLAAIICGGEDGIPLAGALSEHFGCLQLYGTRKNLRNKQVQQDMVAAAGLHSARSVSGEKWPDVAWFCKSELFPIVVKPAECAGSEGVCLCDSEEEARRHFEMLVDTLRCGPRTALLQSYVDGEEYVVDCVSRQGTHKVVMLWHCDKRSANGAPFVYFSEKPLAPGSEVARELLPYARGVLDALGIINGATHMEVKMSADGPCLIECNCRCHGGSGAWRPLARACVGGYDQVSATVDVFIDAPSFELIPELPPDPLACGQFVVILSYHEGKLAAIPGFERIRGLESFVSLEPMVWPGQRLQCTIDMYTVVALCVLQHTCCEVVEQDVATIRSWEMDGSLFELLPEFKIVRKTFAFNRNTQASRRSGPQSLKGIG